MAAPDAAQEFSVGLGGTRAQAMQRLKVGVGGLVAMLLLVGFASTVIEQTRDAQDPAEAMTSAKEGAPQAKDPLVDIGVQPELPVEEVVVPDLPDDQVVPAEEPRETGTPPAG